MADLDAWVGQQHGPAVAGMLRSVSPTDIVKLRPGFGQSMRARRGAIVASPVLAAWDPEPDYFFHWYRDSAVVVDALRLLFAEGSLGEEAVRHLSDFVDFSLALRGRDGRVLDAAAPTTSPANAAAWRARVHADFQQYLRSPAELAAVHGDAVAADTRVNPDGTLDISRWSRPQHDGPPLRALALLRWLHEPRAASALAGGLGARIAALLQADLAFTRMHWSTPSFDIWEEELGLHYYTLRVSAAALAAGARWLSNGSGGAHDDALAQALGAQAQGILHVLDGYWLEAQGHYRSRVLADGRHSAKELDIALLLAAIHADADTDTDTDTAAQTAAVADAHAARAHTPGDPRLHASLSALEALFAAQYPINHARPAGRGPAMGRYAGDVYFSGGAYYFSTLGAAEFCYRAALRSPSPQAWIARGEGFLETVRAYTPADGALSEQFDRVTGAQTSARHLAWSYAAFLTCAAARRRARAAA